MIGSAMMGSNEFPRLTAANHQITSAATPDYNCISWSAGDTGHWWQPDGFWRRSDVSPP
jgi:hypothetical protein